MLGSWGFVVTSMDANELQWWGAYECMAHPDTPTGVVFDVRGDGPAAETRFCPVCGAPCVLSLQWRATESGHKEVQVRGLVTAARNLVDLFDLPSAKSVGQLGQQIASWAEAIGKLREEARAAAFDTKEGT